jgi:hypothetical protein
MAESTRVRRYTAQLVILEEPEIAGEIRAWAERLDHAKTGQNLAPTLRELVRAGLAVKRSDWEAALGALEVGELERHIENAVK